MCVPGLVKRAALPALASEVPVISVSPRRGILPRWTAALVLPLVRVAKSPRYDHHFLAMPAAVTDQGALVAPEILLADLLARGILAAAPGARVQSGMRYHACSVDRDASFGVAHDF